MNKLQSVYFLWDFSDLQCANAHEGTAVWRISRSSLLSCAGNGHGHVCGILGDAGVPQNTLWETPDAGTPFCLFRYKRSMKLSAVCDQVRGHLCYLQSPQGLVVTLGVTKEQVE